MGVNIYDLAREAGVGIGTVSRCLNKHPSVSPGTRAKVLAAVERLNYRPHPTEKRLATGKRRTVSLIVPFLNNNFFVEVFQGIQDKAAELGLHLIIYGMNDRSQESYTLRRSIQYGHVDGMVCFSMKLPESYVARFQQINMPLVSIDADNKDFDSLCVRNKDGAMKATQHLISLGHRNIVMINASHENESAKPRTDGYRAALEQSGLPFSASSVFTANIDKQDGFNREAGHASMREIVKRMSLQHPVTAVFVSSDIQAIGALDAARELGVRVPEDIAMVSFGDIELARHAELSTMRVPMHEMGSRAIEKLQGRMGNPSLSPSLETFLPELIVRRTCGAKGSLATKPRNSPTIELGKLTS